MHCTMVEKQKVIVGCESSEKVIVESVVSQGVVLGSLLFISYVNYIGKYITSNIQIFADDCVLYKDKKVYKLQY